jgi:hypothetical protein
MPAVCKLSRQQKRAAAEALFQAAVPIALRHAACITLPCRHRMFLSPHCALASGARMRAVAARRRGPFKSMIRDAAKRFRKIWGNRAESGRQVNYRKHSTVRLSVHLRRPARPDLAEGPAKIGRKNKACASGPRTLLKRHIKDIVLLRGTSPARPAL